MKEEKNSRRSFLKKTWIVLGIAAITETIYLIFDFLRPSRKKEKKELGEYFVAGKVDEFAHGSVTPFRKHKFYLTRLKNGGFLALSLQCTHLKCAITWDVKKNEFICPCHSSRFDKAGRVLQAPAARPLEIHPITIANGQIKVDISKTVKRKVKGDLKEVFV